MCLARRSIAFLFTASLVACGGSLENELDAALDGHVSEDATTDAGDASAGDGSVDADSDAGELDPILLTLRALAGEGAPAPAVSISVVGTDGAPVVTDAEGWADVEFPGPGVYLLRFAGDAVLTTLIAADVTEGTMDSPSIQLFPADTFDFLEGVLGTSLDGSLGLVLFHFQPAVDGGQSAALTSGGAYVYGEGGAPVPGNTLLAGGQPDVLFVDVPVGQAYPSHSTSNDGEACVASPSDVPKGGWVVESGAMTRMMARCHLTP
jgi:hypothetical protein